LSNFHTNIAPSWFLLFKTKFPCGTVGALHTSAEIVTILNERGLRTGEGNRFILPRVKSIERLYGLKSRYERLRAAGMLTRFEIAERLGITRYLVEKYRNLGLL